jgi:AraC-like DNA-binding protein
MCEMIVQPTVCVKALRAAFFTATARSGTPLSELATHVGVSLSILTDLGARIPHSTVVQVWDAFADHCKEPAFGLIAAGFIGGAPLDILDHALLRAPTLRELTVRFQRYQSLFHDANDVAVIETGALLTMRHRLSSSDGTTLARSRHLVEFILALWATRFRIATCKPLLSLATTFRHEAPIDRTLHRAMFGDDVTFGAEHDSITIERSLVDEPLASADAVALAAFDVHLALELGKRAKASFAECVRVAVVEQIKRGRFDIDAAARSIACSRRTLQRRLTTDGTSFREVLDNARREVALEAIMRGGAMTTVTDLTFLLGFSELSAFSRAFRRWTGKSPATYLRGRT